MGLLVILPYTNNPRLTTNSLTNIQSCNWLKNSYLQPVLEVTTVYNMIVFWPAHIYNRPTVMWLCFVILFLPFSGKKNTHWINWWPYDSLKNHVICLTTVVIRLMTVVKAFIKLSHIIQIMTAMTYDQNFPQSLLIVLIPPVFLKFSSISFHYIF